jgi:hypothetical protein
MPKSEFECCIWDSLKNKFIYGDSSEEALKEAKTWSKDKVMTFKKILGRIKVEQGYKKDPDNENGKFVYLPFFGGKYMAVFFEPLLKKQFYIYKIVIGQKQK